MHGVGDRTWKSIYKLIIPIRLEVSEEAGLYYICSDNKQRH